MNTVHIDHARSVVFTEQDTGLEALSSVIGRQKQMALDLGNEVDDQNGNGCYRWEASFFFGVRKLLEDGFRLSNFGGLGGIQVLRNAFVWKFDTPSLSS